MRLLVPADLRKAAARPGGQTGLSEGGLVELGEGARVERVLEVLEGQRVLEDGRI